MVAASVQAAAAEGGAWGMATLAAFRAARADGEDLTRYLAERVFAGAELETTEPDPADVAGFAAFIERYVAALPVERAAAELG